MNNILILFGGKAYDRQTERTIAALGETDIAWHVFDDRWLMDTPFYEMNRWIFERQPQHGFGFCSWKPYIIEYALRCWAQTGDVVMYLDADTYPVADITCLFEYARERGIMLFEEQGCVNRTWIKEECFRAMHCSNEPAKNAMHACGRFQLFRKGDTRVPQFLQMWQAYSLNPECQFHGGSKPGIPDDSTFIRNSCEQSVLSLLAFQFGITLHRTPDQNGWPVGNGGMYKPLDTYPQLFFQDGARGNVGDRSGSRFRNL